MEKSRHRPAERELDVAFIEARARAYAKGMEEGGPEAAAAAAAAVVPPDMDESKGGGWKEGLDLPATGEVVHVTLQYRLANSRNPR